MDGAGNHRLVWHARVHERFQEKYHIYLIAGRNTRSSDTFSQRFRKLFRSLEIDSANVNAVYGEHDIAIGVWATPSSRQRLLRGIERANIDVHEIQEFVADETATILASSLQLPPELATIDHERAQIEAIVRAVRSQKQEDVEGLISSLINRGLIREDTTPRGVRFLMFLRHQANRKRQPPSYVFEEMVNLLRETALLSATISAGSGFADFVIDAIAPDFDSLLPAVNQLRIRAKELTLEPWTLPLADYSHASIGDSIDALNSQLSDSLEAFVTQVEPDEIEAQVRRELLSLESGVRGQLALLIDQVRVEIGDYELLQRFYEVLQAIVLKDRKLLNRSLSFLTSIEDDLREYLPRVMHACLGDDWVKKLKAEFDPGTLESMKTRLGQSFLDAKLQQWSLAMLLRALSTAYSSFPTEVGTVLHRQLPDGWRGKIHDIVIIRDQFAHGEIASLIKPKTEITVELNRVLLDIAFAIKFQHALENEVYGTT